MALLYVKNHQASVHEITDQSKVVPTTYWPTCSCGWNGGWSAARDIRVPAQTFTDWLAAQNFIDDHVRLANRATTDLGVTVLRREYFG